VNAAVASCGGRFEPAEVKDARFPADELESAGFLLARSTEWVVLTRELVRYAAGPGLMPFKQLIGMHAGADEIFWPTLVLNIPNFTQKVSRQRWYMKWDPAGTGHSPMVLTEAHLKEILNQKDQYLFMRKVTDDASVQLMRQIDSDMETEPGGFIQLDFSSGWELPLDHRRSGCVRAPAPTPAPYVPPPFPAPAPPVVSALSS